MYYLYQEEQAGSKTSFKKLEQTHLDGCNVGLIANYLKKTIAREHSEPCKWHIKSDDLFKTLELPGNTLIINAKPDSKKSLLLFKIKNIWGHSHNGWTPILLELKVVVGDENPDLYNLENIELENYEQEDSVFTSLYLNGSVKNGTITGEWNFPGPSPTNSVFLWPETRKYFISKMTACD